MSRTVEEAGRANGRRETAFARITPPGHPPA